MRDGPWPRSGRLLRHLCFSSSFLRCFNPGGSGHVKGARAHRAQRGRPLTWPRQDYIACLEEEEKRRSNRQPRAVARVRPPAWSPPSRLAVRGRSTRPATGARPHTARPVKDRSTYPGSAATHEGRGGTLPPHGPPATASAASGTRVRRLSPDTRRACNRGSLGAVSDPQSPLGGIGGRGSSRTGKAQRRRCLPLCP